MIIPDKDVGDGSQPCSPSWIREVLAVVTKVELLQLAKHLRLQNLLGALLCVRRTPGKGGTAVRG
jgi:hypothetical protein